MKARKLFASSRLVLTLAIFVLAFGVRLLSWHDTRLEVGKVQGAVTADYKRIAELLRQGGVHSFFSSSSPLADLNNLGHPPGYSILIALVSSAFGGSDTTLQFVQITCDAFAAVMIFAIVAELLSISTAAVAGLLAAFSPQFAWNSVLLLPDSVAVLPILVAVYCLVLAIKRPRLLLFLASGLLIGVSCWLRANAMFFSVFVAAAALLVFRRSTGRRYALAVLIGTVLIVLPLTVRNAVVFHRFIPLSLGAGQTMLEGIAEYDPQGRFGIPKTDIGIMKQEAEQSGRPDYYGTLFNPDGVERERARLARGFEVVSSHPFWFAGVIVRRASSILRLERARLISLNPPVTHSLDEIKSLQPIWSNTPTELLAAGTVSGQANATVAADTQMLQLNCDDSKYGAQFVSQPVTVGRNIDYVFVIPIKIERGRMRISITGSGSNSYAASIVETREDKAAQDQPVSQIPLAFVSGANESLRIELTNEAPDGQNPIVKIGQVDLYELGPARFLWTRYPRALVHAIQKLFLTALMLPLAVAGLVLLMLEKRWRALPVLLVAPIYYMSVQSMVHTEYRYVLAVDYFTFTFVGVAVNYFGKVARLRMFPLSL